MLTSRVSSSASVPQSLQRTKRFLRLEATYLLHILMRMLIELARLLVGVVLMAFHRPIADYFVDLDHVLTSALRSQGFRLPTPPPQSTMHTVYFCLGIFVSIFSLAQIYSSLPS